MTTPFGARLRQHREQQELSLASVADRTKIKASLLESLERGDISQWPRGIYRRAYVRAYATAIGLDADTVAREFLETFPEPVEIVATPPPPAGLRGLVGSAIGSLSRIRHTGWAQPHVETPLVPPPPERHVPERHVPEPSVIEQTVEERIDRPTETVPTMGRVAVEEEPAVETSRPVDLLAAARLCTELGRVETAAQVQPLLAEAAALLDAKGLIVWVWDGRAAQLRPVLVHGYSEQVVARLPAVGRDEDNVTAAAYRSAQTLAVCGTARTSGALALPLLTPSSCAGVLTIELPQGSGDTESVRAVATFFAAMLAQLVGGGEGAASAPQDQDEPADTPSLAVS